jgi:hypothetical protein
MNRKTILGIALILIAFWSYTQILFQVNATPTYYGDFQTVQLLESSGLYRKWLVYNNTWIYNNAKIIPYSEDESLLNRTYIGGYINIASIQDGSHFKMLFDNIPKNYSMYNEFIISFYGSNSGKTYLGAFSSANDGNYYYNITDSSTGFVNYIFNINSLSKNTNANISSIKWIWAFYNLNHTFSNYRLNSIGFKTFNYYEIWLGSTLKYQGLINPDINDFVTDVPIFTATNTIQLNTVYIGMIAGIIGAITALGLWWIGLLILAIDFTFLYQFLLDAKVITGYTIASNNQVITLVETYSDLRLFCVLILIAGCVCIVIGALNKLMND